MAGRRTPLHPNHVAAGARIVDFAGWEMPQQYSSVKDEQACDGGPGNPHTMDQYRRAEAQHVVAEPGVVVYGDPDPQSSPIGPYPLPAAYVGTCGVTAGGGTAPAAPASPVTNSAGQVSVSTGC